MFSFSSAVKISLELSDSLIRVVCSYFIGFLKSKKNKAPQKEMTDIIIQQVDYLALPRTSAAIKLPKIYEDIKNAQK